jgi:hypothetical protein
MTTSPPTRSRSASRVPERWRRRGAVALGIGTAAVVVAVLGRLAFDALTGPAPREGTLQTTGAFLAALIAAIVTFTGAWFARSQAKRTEHRLELDTAVGGLKLLTVGDGSKYAPKGVVAGAIATLAHLEHQVIAMRALAACWADDAVDVTSATWLISEVLASNAEEAQVEAAALLDARAGELCQQAPGRFSWPARIEFRWIPDAPFAARLRVMRAVLKMQVSRPPEWWYAGGRLGWAVGLLHEAMRTERNHDLKTHAKTALEILTRLVSPTLESVQAERNLLAMSAIESAMTDVPSADRLFVALAGPMQQLEDWVDAAIEHRA